MNVNPVSCAHLVLVSPAIVRPPCSCTPKTPVHVRPASWYLQGRLFFFTLVAFPASVSAAPWTVGGLHKRQGNTDSNGSSSNGSISMSVWLPILLVTVVFVLFSFVTCLRRCATPDAPATRNTNRTASSTAGGDTARQRRRPRRTPSQISTKSLPPYMKDPGDHELVLFRGPQETDDEAALPRAMPTLAEDDEHPEMRGAMFDIALNRTETVDTMADSSTTNLIRRASESVPRPPELHLTAMPHDHHPSGDVRGSLDSVGSQAELLASHQRGVSVDNSTDSRGEAPSYTEATSVEGVISLNDHGSSNAHIPPALIAVQGRSRFSFLTQNPFTSHSDTSGALSNENQSTSSIRSESPALHLRSGSALSRFSTCDSHESHHARTPSNNLSRSRSRSGSNLLRNFRSHSPGLHAGSSTISLDSISAPLTHTVTRAEFHAPKGGWTPEQIKLITSREALERFGMPYGPDAVAAFSLSRERLADMGPPPDFESVTGEHQMESGVSGDDGSATETTAQRSESVDADTAQPRSTSPLESSLSHRGCERAGSCASTVVSSETAPESDGQVQVVQAHTTGDEEMDGARTARPMTPRTARPLRP